MVGGGAVKEGEKRERDRKRTQQGAVTTRTGPGAEAIKGPGCRREVEGAPGVMSRCRVVHSRARRCGSAGV